MDYVGRVVEGDSLSVLGGIADGIVQVCITSPPYWSLL